MPAAEPKIWPCWRNSQAPRIQGSAPEPPGPPCLRSPTTLISPPTQLPSPGRPAPPIPSPAWTWSSFAKTRSSISHFPAAARAVQEVAADKAADPAEEARRWRRRRRFRRRWWFRWRRRRCGGRGGRGGRGGGGGGFGNFRNFKPNQPHGAFFWTGGNSALNANPFPIRAQNGAQPSYAQNQFGLTFMGAPYIPHLIEHDTKDVIFFNASGQRSSFALQPIRHRAHRR